MKQIFTPIQRQRLWTASRVLLLTYLAVFAQSAGYLTRLEHVLYDQRVALCQTHMPAPASALVHLDIDDTAVSQVGRWPWHRDTVAEILDEVRLADPKVVSMDILFAEPEDITYDRTGTAIDRNARLTESIKNFGRVLVPASLSFEPRMRPTQFNAKLMEIISAQPDLNHEQCNERLRAAGFDQPNMADHVNRAMLVVRPEVIYERIHSQLANDGSDNTPAARAQLRMKLFPHADPQFTGSVLDRLFDEEYDRALRERAMERFTLNPPAVSTPILHGYDEITPILSLSNAAAFSAFVNYVPDQAEGTVRRVPLVASYRGRLMPHMALATACAMLDVDVHDLRFAADSITIPRKNAPDIVIPTHTIDQTGIGPVGYLMEIPMFGKRGNWQTMYDFHRYTKPAQHISVYEVWRICQTRHRMASNEALADQVLVQSLALLDPKASASYESCPLTGVAKRKLVDETLANMSDVATGLASVPGLGPQEQKLLQNLKMYDTELRQIQKHNDAMQKQLVTLRADLHTKLQGKAIFLGGTSTGHVDQFPTSLHAQCPGVVVHGAIVNAILTGKMWRVAPSWITLILTGVIALLTGILTTTLSPAKSFVSATLLCTGYLAFNGYVLFDHYNILVGAAGPAFAVMMVWSAITLFDFITAASERARITRRFSSYVDPSLVNYVINHPEQARFDGESREMTMGFTDLAGFTSLTETLGPRTVPLLAEYMNSMIPTIRAHQGYVSRLMGDGIYFFFGAPEPDTNHAAHAVNTLLDMQKAMDRLNLTLPQRGFPELTMRAGLCTGNVIVGDAGSTEFHDYTAVGDSVNTAARLETANKFLGTKALVSARTIELLDGRFVSRPVANLRVAGKSKGLMVYEPLCRKGEETPEKIQLADLSVQVVSTFQCGNFDGCIEAADRLERAFGASKFSAMYRMLSLQYQESLPDDFDGQVILTEK